MLIVQLGSVSSSNINGCVNLESGIVTSDFCCPSMAVHWNSAVKINEDNMIVINDQVDDDTEYRVTYCPWCGEKIHHYDHLGVDSNFDWSNVVDQIREELESTNIYKHYKEDNR